MTVRELVEWKGVFFAHLDELGLVEDDLVIASIFGRFRYDREVEDHIREQSDRWREEYPKWGTLYTDGSVRFNRK